MIQSQPKKLDILKWDNWQIHSWQLSQLPWHAAAKCPCIQWALASCHRGLDYSGTLSCRSFDLPVSRLNSNYIMFSPIPTVTLDYSRQFARQIYINPSSTEASFMQLYSIFDLVFLVWNGGIFHHHITINNCYSITLNATDSLPFIPFVFNLSFRRLFEEGPPIMIRLSSLWLWSKVIL